MKVKPSFILCFADFKISFQWLLVIGYYFGRINHFRYQAFIANLAVDRVSAVAKILICLIFFGSNVLVVRIYNFYLFVHTTIANLHVVFIKYFMILMIFSEVLL